jgi:hypothetical protein
MPGTMSIDKKKFKDETKNKINSTTKTFLSLSLSLSLFPSLPPFLFASFPPPEKEQPSRDLATTYKGPL